MSNEENRAEELARDLHEAATETRFRVSGTPVEKWPLIAETERAVYRAMAFRALHYDEVVDLNDTDLSCIEGGAADISHAADDLERLVRRMRAALTGKAKSA